MPAQFRTADQGTLPLMGLDDELSALRDEVVKLRTENARLVRLLELTPQQARPPGPVQTSVFESMAGPVHAGSPASAKVAFFAGLFAGRPDVYALRWENARTGRAGWVPALRGGWRKGIPAARYGDVVRPVLPKSCPSPANCAGLPSTPPTSRPRASE